MSAIIWYWQWPDYAPGFSFIQRQREPDHQQHGDKGGGPLGQHERGESGGRDLDQQPRHDRIGNRDPEDIAAFEFNE